MVYHNFVKSVPEEDPDNFNYINTPQSFEENIKVLLENGYTIISMKELNDAYNFKFELPSKPIVITFDDGYYSNYEYIYPILKEGISDGTAETEGLFKLPVPFGRAVCAGWQTSRVCRLEQQ